MENPILVMVASPSARAGERSPFLRFVRDHADTLRRMSLHCTEGTANSLRSTGLYGGADLHTYRPGTKGGIVQLAALVARLECAAVILLTDVLDQGHDEVVTRVVKRIANQAPTRLITTYGDAVLWARLEAPDTEQSRLRLAPPENWRDGVSNVERWPLPLSERTLALTAHDESKRDMLHFVAQNVDILTMHYRVLATGVTGWMLRLVFSRPEDEPGVLEALHREGLEDRMKSVLVDLCMPSAEAGHPALLDLDDVRRKLDRHALPELLAKARKKWNLAPSPELVANLIAVMPGPAGGDVFLSNEVLENRCDTVICLHHPRESLPHTDDSRMLEHTCQLPSVRAACLSNISAAFCWADGVRRELDPGSPPDRSDELRVLFGLAEVIVVDHPSDTDSEPLGDALCRAAAGYLYAAVERLRAQAKVRVAVSWGWASHHVVEQLQALARDRSIARPVGIGSGFIWCPSIGNLPSPSSPYAMNAGTVATGLAEFFGGATEDFSSGTQGLVDDLGQLTAADERLMRILPTSDLVLTSASAWNPESSIVKYAPESTKGVAIGAIGAVQIDEHGREVSSGQHIVGLQYGDLREAAKRGAVVMIAGGENRRHVVLAALRQRLTSVLITSRATAEWLVLQQSTPVPEPVPEELSAKVDADDLEALLDEAGTRGIDRARLQAIITALLELLPDAPSGAGPPGEPLTADELALLAREGLDTGSESGRADVVVRTAAKAAELLAGALTVQQAADHLSVSEVEVEERISRRVLYAVGGRLPAFQFTDDGVVPGIDRVFQVAPRELHLVELWRWLTTVDPDFDVMGEPLSPLDWLLSGGDIERVVKQAESI